MRVWERDDAVRKLVLSHEHHLLHDGRNGPMLPTRHAVRADGLPADDLQHAGSALLLEQRLRAELRLLRCDSAGLPGRLSVGSDDEGRVRAALIHFRGA
jgi:hypothetical protein